MRPISILQISATGKRVGVSGVLSLLARGLRDRGHRVRVVSIDGGPLIEEMEEAGIPADTILTSHQVDLDAVLRVRAYLARHRIDVVHTHGQRAMFVGNLAARLERVPAIVTSFHEIAAVKSTTSRWHRAYTLGEAWLARACTDLCIATSRPVAEDMRAVRKIPAAKLVTVLNAIDRDRFQVLADPGAAAAWRARHGIAAEDRLIGCLGSMVPIKGHRYLIEALPRILERVPCARVVIAGEGPLRDELAALADRLGVAERVLLPGVVVETNLFYNALDVVALPSLSESSPLVILEAIACGKPVVASRVGGVPDLVRDQETGLLVPPADVSALADALVRVLLDAELARSMTEKAARFADRELSAERQVARHEEIYRSLLRRRGSSQPA